MESFIFKNVTFSYPEIEQKALQELSFSVHKGEFLAFRRSKAVALPRFRDGNEPRGAYSRRAHSATRSYCSIRFSRASREDQPRAWDHGDPD